MAEPRPAGPGPAISFVGLLVGQKGYEYLVRAASFVVAAHPSVRFMVVGDGPELGRLTALARELGLATPLSLWAMTRLLAGG